MRGVHAEANARPTAGCGAPADRSSVEVPGDGNKRSNPRSNRQSFELGISHCTLPEMLGSPLFGIAYTNLGLSAFLHCSLPWLLPVP